MKFRITFLLLFVGYLGFAQCVPDSLITAPGVYPVSDSIPCIIQGQPYSATLTFMFGDTLDYFPYNGENPIDSFRIDSITNLPCGITWATTESLQYEYLPARAGCIQLSGTTTDPVGQYEIQVYYDSIVVAYIAGYGYDVFAVHDSIRKDLRVIASGGNCPAVDTTLTGSIASCNTHKVEAPPPSLSVFVFWKDTICSGDTTLLIANVTGNQGPVKYMWSPSTGLSCTTCDSVYASPDTTTTYTLVASDSLSSDTLQVTITVDTIPIIASDSIYSDGLILQWVGDHTFCLYYVAIVKPESQEAPAFVVSSINGGSNPVYNWIIDGQATGISTDTFPLFDDSNHVTPILAKYIGEYPNIYPDSFCLITCRMTSSLSGCVQPRSTVSIPDTLYNSCYTGINSLSQDNEVKIYPNPNNGSFLLSFDQPSQQLNIELLNIQGQRLYMEELKDVSLLSKEYNFNELAKGVYLLKITTESGIAVKRIVVQ